MNPSDSCLIVYDEVIKGATITGNRIDEDDDDELAWGTSADRPLQLSSCLVAVGIWSCKQDVELGFKLTADVNEETDVVLGLLVVVELAADEDFGFAQLMSPSVFVDPLCPLAD